MEPVKRCVVLVLIATLCRVVLSDEENLLSIIDYTELDYEDQCNVKGENDWKELLGKPAAFIKKLEQDKAIGNTIRQVDDLNVESADYYKNPNNPVINRKLELLLAPGDALLPIDQWNRLISFADEAIHKLETSRDYNCGSDPNEPCTLADVRRRLASGDVSDGARKRIKGSWEQKLPNVNDYVTQILPLLKNASKVNSFDSVEKYWSNLVEYEGAVEKARELWEHVQPLYEKLQRHVSGKLRAAGLPVNTDTTIPVRSLGSLLGEDWINVAELVLPDHANIYDVINRNLHLKHMGGREAFVKASKLIKDLNLGDIKEKFWVESVFDQTCPTKLVDFCVGGAVRVFTCNNVSLANYLDAHEALMRAKYKEMEASYTNNTYIIRQPNRYSAVYEAISGLAPLLALTPHQLDKSKLVPLKYFKKNSGHNSVVLQMIFALRDLPRLNYYLAADEWRLKTLKEFPAPIPLGHSWSDFRRTFSLVEPGDKDFLGDQQILLNKPYLANFFGIILKYQIFQSFIDYSYDVNEDLVAEIAKNSARITEPMTRAFSVKWPELVSDIVAKKEYGVDSGGLADYFALLNDYLDKSQGSSNAIIDDFEQPEPSDLFETTSEKQSEEFDDDHFNEIDRFEALSESGHEKEDIRENTESVLANKNLIAKEESRHEEEASAPLQNQDSNGEVQQAGSNNYYIWIGIAVVVAIILILVSIIVKKRISHRKQLERERKEHSRA